MKANLNAPSGKGSKPASAPKSSSVYGGATAAGSAAAKHSGPVHKGTLKVASAAAKHSGPVRSGSVKDSPPNGSRQMGKK